MTAVLWDLDDTLLNTLPGRMNALAHAYEACLGAKTDPEALWRSHRGGTLEDMGRRLLGESGYLRFVDTYRDHYYGLERNIQPFSGVVAALDALQHADVPMAIVTSKIAWGATEELTSAGMLQYFHSIVGFDDTDLHKPDPAPVYEALDRLLMDPSKQIVFVGDSPADIWAAKNAGVTSVAAMWGTLDAELLLDAQPDHTARSPGEVLAVIAGEATRHD